jgi:hypothetical protein
LFSATHRYALASDTWIEYFDMTRVLLLLRLQHMSARFAAMQDGSLQHRQSMLPQIGLYKKQHRVSVLSKVDMVRS